MRIAILGTGHLAEALGTCWVRAGHRITVAGRTPERATLLAARLNRAADSVARRDAAADSTRERAVVAMRPDRAADSATGRDAVADSTPEQVVAAVQADGVGHSVIRVAAAEPTPEQAVDGAVYSATSRSAAAGPVARAATPRDAVRGADAVLLAVPWDAAPEVIEAAGGADGSWAGLPVVDPTNPVGHGVGVVLNPPGVSNAQRIADAAPGSHVVKGFHLVPSTQWGSADAETSVVLCGDDPAALDTVATLVRDAGAVPVVLGPLTRARQLEEAAGLLIGLAFAGVDPRTVVPALPPVRA